MTDTIDKTEPTLEQTEADEQKRRKVNSAKVHTCCFSKAAMTMDRLRSLDPVTAMQAFIDSADKVNAGSCKEIEQMLMTQAKVLDFFFYDTLNKLPSLDMMNQIQTFADIALRAQSQCRKTLAVLAELKHPRRATFIKQQNNAINQQVNNDVQSACANTENNKKVANELLEVKDEQWLDAGKTAEAVPNDSDLEAVAISRSKNT